MWSVPSRMYVYTYYIYIYIYIDCYIVYVYLYTQTYRYMSIFKHTLALKYLYREYFKSKVYTKL